jgi:hypothetical protein
MILQKCQALLVTERLCRKMKRLTRFHPVKTILFLYEIYIRAILRVKKTFVFIKSAVSWVNIVADSQGPRRVTGVEGVGEIRRHAYASEPTRAKEGSRSIKRLKANAVLSIGSLAFSALINISAKQTGEREHME